MVPGKFQLVLETWVGFFDGLAKLSAQWLEALDYDPDRVYTTLSAFGLFLESQDKARFKGYGGEIEASAASSMGLFRGKNIRIKSDYGDDVNATIEAGVDVNEQSYINLEADEVAVNGVPIEPPIDIEFSLTAHSGTTGTINSGAMGESSFTASKAGWIPIAIAGFGTSNGSGSGSSYAIINIMRMSNRKEGSCTISWRIRAYGGQVKTCAVNVDVLWMRKVQQVLPT